MLLKVTKTIFGTTKDQSSQIKVSIILYLYIFGKFKTCSEIFLDKSNDFVTMETNLLRFCHTNKLYRDQNSHI